MAARVKFLHLADLHIGHGAGGFDESTAARIREMRFKALDKALDLAEKLEVEFIVIAGDLFDDNMVSRTDADRVFDNLRGKRVPVFVLPGNHDPFRTGSVWDRPPWTNWRGTAIVLLHERAPVAARDGVTLFPGVVRSPNSLVDPTAWIRDFPRRDDGIRLAVAHGSVNDRATLAHDDHLIDPQCFAALDLDYVALGHWHGPKEYRDADGQVRMAYPGTHEQMNFPPAGRSAGLVDDVFLGGAKGRCLLVEIEREGGRSVVRVDAEDIGCLAWEQRVYEGVDDARLSEIHSRLGREDIDPLVLRLKLRGMVSLEKRASVSGLEEMVKGRCVHAELDLAELLTRPDPEEVRRALGEGVWLRVIEEIEAARATADDPARALLSEAVFTLYQCAREAEGKS